MQRYAAVWSEQSAGIALPMAAMTVGRGRGKGAIVNQLRFEAGLGHYSVNVAPDSVWIFRGMGTHYFQVQLQIGIPEVGAGAGRLLAWRPRCTPRRAAARGYRSRQRTPPSPSTPRARSGCRRCNTSLPTRSCWRWNNGASATRAWSFR